MEFARLPRVAIVLVAGALALGTTARADPPPPAGRTQQGRATTDRDSAPHSWIGLRVGDAGPFVAELGTLRSAATPGWNSGATLALQGAGAVTEVAVGHVCREGYELQALYAEVPIALRLTASTSPSEDPLLATPPGDLLRGRLCTAVGGISCGLKWRPWFLCRAAEANGTNLGVMYGYQWTTGLGEVRGPNRALVESATAKESYVAGVDLRVQHGLVRRWFATLDLLALASDEPVVLRTGATVVNVPDREVDRTYSLIRFGLGLNYRF